MKINTVQPYQDIINPSPHKIGIRAKEDNQSTKTKESANLSKETKIYKKLRKLYKKYNKTKKDTLINKISKLEYKYIIQLKINNMNHE